MPAPTPAARPPIAVRSIVQYDGYQWTVVGRIEEAGLPGRGVAATLRLEREEQEKTTTPYGKPQRYRTVKRHAQIAEGRVRLLGVQTEMIFD